ncbi:MAG TPA: hypothetical protein PKB06_02320 [Actinotalea sp.]|nr:hypothetical protein [Actinotalea sp.]
MTEGTDLACAVSDPRGRVSCQYSWQALMAVRQPRDDEIVDDIDIPAPHRTDLQCRSTGLERQVQQHDRVRAEGLVLVARQLVEPAPLPFGVRRLSP